MAAPKPIHVMTQEHTVQGNKRVVLGTFIMPLIADGGYPTGGASFDPSQFGLAILDQLDLQPGIGTVPALAVGIVIVQTANLLPLKSILTQSAWTGLIFAYWAATAIRPLVEVAGGTELDSFQFPFTATGV